MDAKDEEAKALLTGLGRKLKGKDWCYDHKARERPSPLPPQQHAGSLCAAVNQGAQVWCPAHAACPSPALAARCMQGRIVPLADVNTKDSSRLHTGATFRLDPPKKGSRERANQHQPVPTAAPAKGGCV